MNTERLAKLLFHGLSFDTETDKTQPGIAAPPLVCASVAMWDPAACRPNGKLLDATQALDVWLTALADDRITLVMANAAFDMLVMAVEAARARKIDVMPLVFAAYEAGRVLDIQIVEALHHIALGCLNHDPATRGETYYSLEDVHRMTTGKLGAKANDRFRTSYALLRPYPIDQWRAIAGNEAVDYPIDDAVNTFEDGVAQAGLIPNRGPHAWLDNGRGITCTQCGAPQAPGVSVTCVSTFARKNIHDAATQAYTHWVMQLGAAWGLTPDPVTVAELKYSVTKDLVEDIKPFVAAGIVREDGTECQAVLKGLVARAYGSMEPCPTCKDTTEEVGTGRGKARTFTRVATPGRIPNITPKGVHNTIACPDCDGTALKLSRITPRAEKGGVSKGKDQLFESGDELLMAYGLFGEHKKTRTTYVPFLEEGIHQDLHLREDELTPEGLASCIARIQLAGTRGVWPITLKPNVLLETNRTSYRDKTQTMPRLGGIRQCFKARDGYVYYSNDYAGIELATWAQICIWMVGHSDLAIALNKGENVHGALGAQMAGESYEAFMTKVKAGDPIANAFRQAAKPGNFMFPGGGGIVTFVQIQREQGPNTPHPSGPLVARKDMDGIKQGERYYKGLRFCLLIGGAQRCGEVMAYDHNKKEIAPTCKKCIECAAWIHEGWGKKWSEAKPYFAKITAISKTGYQKHPISNRIRGGLGFCDTANGYFQELAAQGGKDALRHVVREQYDCSYRFDESTGLDGESILLNRSRNIPFLHDELLGEAREDVAPECAERIGVVMEKRMKIYVPDVVVSAEPTLMPRWYKEAKCVRDENGRLQVWRPKQ